MTLNKKTISIDKDSCIKCGKCVSVCPYSIMIQKHKGDEISLNQVDNCFTCGHCMDVCPTDSVIHSAFPPEKIHAVDSSLLPTPEQVMMLIKSRRSNRNLTSKPIPMEMLNQIVEAAQYAPTAVNSQQLSFTIITEPQKLQQIRDFTIDSFTSIAKKLKSPVIRWLLKPFFGEVYKYLPMFDELMQQHKAGKDPVLRKATALLIIHSPKSNRWGSVEANLAYQNASLMAQSLGMSQIYMGVILNIIQKDSKGTLPRLLGIDEKIHAVMALGIPTFKYSKYTDR